MLKSYFLHAFTSIALALLLVASVAPLEALVDFVDMEKMALFEMGEQEEKGEMEEEVEDEKFLASALNDKALDRFSNLRLQHKASTTLGICLPVLIPPPERA